MARVRKIHRSPPNGERNYFVLDASFLVNRFIPKSRAPSPPQQDQIAHCMAWWREIDVQLDRGAARVYVPDIIVAEAFKALAKKYYAESWFRSRQDFHYWRTQLRTFVTTPKHDLRSAKRTIRVHDVESNRDIIIAVDRFYELFHRHGKNVSLPDLLIVATAKYLVDFFDIPRDRLHIVTLDRALRDGSRKIGELPNAYDPTVSSDAAVRVFED
jgi:hypothetical protein